MPIYDYRCPQCGEVENVWAKMDDELLPHSCGAMMQRLISPTRCNPDYEPWVDENLGGQQGEKILVKSRRHHKQLLKERGLHIRS
jgi:putative FmdB family regulatory protein